MAKEHRAQRVRARSRASRRRFTRLLHLLDCREGALKATFGEPDPVTLAMTKLDNLLMKDHHHIARYIVEFNEYATPTGYNDHALC